MNKNDLKAYRASNEQSMSILAELLSDSAAREPSIAEDRQTNKHNPTRHVLEQLSITNAIDSLYMQNKLIDYIKDHPSTEMTQILSSFVVSKNNV